MKKLKLNDEQRNAINFQIEWQKGVLKTDLTKKQKLKCKKLIAKLKEGL